MPASAELLKQMAREVAMAPQEQLMEVGRRKKSLSIGIPLEISFQEHRVPLNPSSVAVLVGRDHEVVIERGAGAARTVPGQRLQRSRCPRGGQR